MIITGYTKYFENKWKNEFDNIPSIEELNSHLKNGAVKLQSYISYYDNKKRTMENVLEIFWVPDKNLVFKIDPTSSSAVTFYRPTDKKKFSSKEWVDKKDES